MPEHPKVFISYSHDTPEHKRWVSELGAKLHRKGVEVILDQWDLGPDDDLGLFVERGVKDSDKILVICTDSYVRKAKAGKGGVGYESRIITRQLVQDLGTNKFIPIVRQVLEEDKTPVFLGTQAYIDFTDDGEFGEKFYELLHERLQVPVAQKLSVPYIASLRVMNYRALRDVALKGIKPLSVFVGPNGSGKSTLFDVFAFLAECYTIGLRRAWDKRGRFKDLRTRGSEGPIEFELKYREKSDMPLVTYHLAIDEGAKGPFVQSEWMGWRRGSHGQPFRFLDFQEGAGRVITGEMPDVDDMPKDEQLDDASALAVSTFGQLGGQPRVSALYRFISGWHLSYLSADATRGVPEAGPQERLSETGDNLSNVVQHLKERYPERLERMLSILSDWVPRLEKVDAELMADGRLLLQIKDAPFERPIIAKFASDGTLKMLSYLTLLHDPDPPQLIGIEEPENYLHPRLLSSLTEECRIASAWSQLMITTHSPYFIDELHADELWVMYRDEEGFTVCKRTADIRGINELMETGGKLGHLWMEGFFDCGDPLTNAGGPQEI